MGFFGRLGAAVRGLFFGTPGASSAAYGMLDQIFPYGQPARRGTRELLQAVQRLPWLHAAVWKIGFDVAASEPLLYRVSKGGSKRSVRRAVRKGVTRDAGGGTNYEVKGAELLDDHPMLELLENPNPLLACSVFWALVQAYLDTKGEVFLIIERGADGKPSQLWAVPPHWCRQHAIVENPVFKFTWMGWNRDVPAKDVIWLRHPQLDNPYERGSGIGDSLGDELDIDEFAAKHMKAFFFNRALPDAFVTIKNPGGGSRVQDEIDRWEKKLEEKHRGVGKAWRPHFMQGEVTVTPVGSSLKDQQAKELRNLQRDTLLQVYGIPPECVGIVENSNRATINSALYIYAKNVVLPRQIFLRDALQQLADEFEGPGVLFLAYESPVDEDYDFTLRVMIAQPTLFRKNEFRKLAGKPRAVEFGDDFVEEKAPALAPGAPGDAPAPAEDGPTTTPNEEDDPEQPIEDDDANESKASRKRLAIGPVRAVS